MKTYTLYQLNHLVRQTVENRLQSDYWVEAELAEARESGGHCYMELIDRTPQREARAAARCWRSSWMLIRPHFEQVTGQHLKAGMKLLLCVYPQFHELYGFSWIVTDIDPTYTLGDMARRRMEIINQLKAEGVFDLNKQLTLPLLCQRIAVISSQTAAGYGDFSNQLATNQFGYSFHTELFPALMQGDGVEQSVIAALNAINSRLADFDCVVLIRGGGATADLSGFDTLSLAENVANFPLPVITGIGHERDESILDLIAHTRMKTPTAVAAFLIDRLRQADLQTDQLVARLERVVRQLITAEQSRLARLSESVPRLFSLVRSRQEALLDRYSARLIAALTNRLVEQRHLTERLQGRLPVLAGRKLLAERHRVDLLAQRAQALNPSLLLSRGYSITLAGGKAVTRASQLKSGDIIETRLHQGTLLSVVGTVNRQTD